MNLGKSIQTLRKRQGLTQEALADKAALSRPALSQIENNMVRPEQDTLKRICDALEVPESLVYINSFEKEDVPEGKQFIYDQLFPIIQDMIKRVALEGTKGAAGDDRPEEK